MINRIIQYKNKPYIILDKINVALASGRDEYISLTQYLIADNDGNIKTIYPYDIDKVEMDNEKKEYIN